MIGKSRKRIERDKEEVLGLGFIKLRTWSEVLWWEMEMDFFTSNKNFGV